MIKNLLLGSLLVLVSFSCKENKSKKFDRFPAGKTKEFITTKGINVQDSQLEIGLFASEPDVFNPTNMDIDHKGRVWFCEAYNYRNDVNNVPYEKKGDKIVILEDTNGDGKADKTKVYYQGEDVNAALGICVLGNKVIVSASPNVFVFTDEDGDDIPDKKEILFKTTGGLQSDHGVHAVVFGPDGKLYFSFGNHGGGITDAQGKPLKDIYGREIDQTLRPFQDGMALRCDVDGKNFEVLGWNFRNNYELCIDSYGRIWQSDNDDDGVSSNRINYLLPHGNYGYKDEMTGADWRAYRTNKEDSLYKQHWHQNDPGVVPNLQIIGAGSPTGTFVYEGSLLPEKYRGALFLGDAVNNNIIAYKIHKKNSGFQLEKQTVLDASTNDQWFRPTDVAAGPDGSVFVADWYDVGVGGHAVGDLERGRFYRVYPKGKEKYEVPNYDFSSVSQSIEALQNPSNSVRYLAFTALKKSGKTAEKELVELLRSSNPIVVVRALWLLKDLNSQYLDEFSKSENEDIRAATVRMYKAQDNSPFLLRMAKDPSYQVKMAVATQLYHTENAETWLELTKAYQSGDRWFLEALGIAAEGKWDTYLPRYLEGKDRLNDPAVLDMIWRSRSKVSSGYLADIIDFIPFETSLRYFRALDFQPTVEKNQALLRLLLTSKSEERKLLILKQFDTDFVQQKSEIQGIINQEVSKVKHDKDFLDIVNKYHLLSQRIRVFDVFENSKETAVINQAAIVANGLFGINPLREVVSKIPLNLPLAIKYTERYGLVDHNVVTKQLILIFSNRKYPFALRKAAILAMEGYGSDVKLWDLIKVNKVSPELIPYAKAVLAKTFHNDIKTEFEFKFGVPADNQVAVPMPDFKNGKGNAAEGKLLYENYCSRCHQVGDLGQDFGPGLAKIGSKLTKEGLFTAIVYPNQGVNLGYETTILTLKDGTALQGIVTSKTADAYYVKIVGNNGVTPINAADVVSVQLQDKVSLMPPFPLQEKEMLDLIEFLSGLK